MFGRVWWFWQLDWHSQGDDCDHEDDDADDNDEYDDDEGDDDEGDDCDTYLKGEKELDWCGDSSSSYGLHNKVRIIT